jgi:nicotinate-nucleotide--dimethylbenzimidazole phosphoribosyltransferase
MRSLISPTVNPPLENALLDKLRQREIAAGGTLGELAPLAVRLGVMQGTLNPRFEAPQLVLFAADHGLAVEGAQEPTERPTHEQAQSLLSGQSPLASFAAAQHVRLSVVDCGLAEALPAHRRLLMRKIAHGTRNARVGNAMTPMQAHAGIRAGMEIGESLQGNLMICAGLGAGSQVSAALVLSRLSGCPVNDLLHAGPEMSASRLTQLSRLAQSTLRHHSEVSDPIQVLAAFGGFEMAMMVGAMLSAASKRHLLVIDGLSACAALKVAAGIDRAVTDYCLFARSHSHHGLCHALQLFGGSSMLELGLECTDGTGATLAWPLVNCAAALLSVVADGEEPGPAQTPRSLAADSESVFVDLEFPPPH